MQHNPAHVIMCGYVTAHRLIDFVLRIILATRKRLTLRDTVLNLDRLKAKRISCAP